MLATHLPGSPPAYRTPSPPPRDLRDGLLDACPLGKSGRPGDSRPSARRLGDEAGGLLPRSAVRCSALGRAPAFPRRGGPSRMEANDAPSTALWDRARPRDREVRSRVRSCLGGACRSLARHGLALEDPSRRHHARLTSIASSTSSPTGPPFRSIRDRPPPEGSAILRPTSSTTPIACASNEEGRVHESPSLWRLDRPQA